MFEQERVKYRKNIKEISVKYRRTIGEILVKYCKYCKTFELGMVIGME